MNTPPVKLYVDGDCPLCRREAAWLKRLDSNRGRLALVDIASDGFDPTPHGLSGRDLMSEIHAITPDGQIVTGLEAFRQAYRAVGLGGVLAPTAWPGVRTLADAAYRWFARNRIKLTGRHRRCSSNAC